MQLTAWGHACVRLDHPGGRVLVDPGSFSDLADASEGVATILVTHDHADHLAVEPVAAMVRKQGARVLGPSSVLDALVAAGVPSARLDEVRAGDELDLAGLPVRVTGGLHAEIHHDVPRAVNVGYLAAGVYHPGDSTEPAPGEVRVLLAPVAGPWLRLADTVDLIRATAADVVVPIHDAILTDVGHGVVDRIVRGLVTVGEYRRLALGERLDLD